MLWQRRGDARVVFVRRYFELLKQYEDSTGIELTDEDFESIINDKDLDELTLLALEVVFAGFPRYRLRADCWAMDIPAKHMIVDLASREACFAARLERPNSIEAKE